MIVIIDNFDSFTYNLYQAVAQSIPEVVVYRNDAITIEELDRINCDGIIISPGPGTPQGAGISVELVTYFLDKKPILGVCLGHQVIVTALGGNVVLAESPIHGKDTYVFHNRQGIYKDMPLPFVAGRYHSLIASHDGLPEEIDIEAENDFGIIMGVKHRHYPVFGVQFHPESVLTPKGDQIINNFLKICYNTTNLEKMVKRC